jgi:hypothetical protein
MKEITNLNKLILANLLEILFVIGFIFISIPMCQKLSSSASLATAASFANSNFTNLIVENPAEYVLYPLKSEEAVEMLSPYKLSVVNDTLTEEYYTLFLKIDKNSSLDYKCLDILIDDKVYSLSTLDMSEDSDYYWFKIDDITIKGETFNYNIKIWLDENTENNMQGKSLNLSFDLVQNSSVQI